MLNWMSSSTSRKTTWASPYSCPEAEAQALRPGAKKGKPGPAGSKITGVPHLDNTVPPLRSPISPNFVEPGNAQAGTAWKRDGRLAESKQTMKNVTDAFSTSFGPWRLAANIPHHEGYSQPGHAGNRGAMLLDYRDVNNLKTLVWIWGMYNGEVESAVGEKIRKPLICDQMGEAKKGRR